MMLLSFAGLFAVVLASGLLNRLLRRPLVNGWALGTVAVLAMTASAWGHLTAAGAGYNRGRYYGETVIGFTLVPALFAVWGAKRFARRKRERLSRRAGG
jgi:hypothetical protein